MLKLSIVCSFFVNERCIVLHDMKCKISLILLVFVSIEKEDFTESLVAV